MSLTYYIGRASPMYVHMHNTEFMYVHGIIEQKKPKNNKIK